jgi:hypothetical protein
VLYHLQFEVDPENGESPNQRIIFDGSYKTFRLYPGKSLYAFSISPELSLEHLYWTVMDLLVTLPKRRY